MNNLVLKSNKANFYSNIIRIVLVLLGLIYVFNGLSEIHPEWNLTAMPVLNAILGLALIIVGINKSTIGANVEINITDDFLQTTEDLVYTRSAYWNKLQKIALTKFSIRITYKSGSGERFRLPFVTSNEFNKLKNVLAKKSETYDFQFEEKAWWKIF